MRVYYVFWVFSTTVKHTHTSPTFNKHHLLHVTLCLHAALHRVLLGVVLSHNTQDCHTTPSFLSTKDVRRNVRSSKSVPFFSDGGSNFQFVLAVYTTDTAHLRLYFVTQHTKLSQNMQNCHATHKAVTHRTEQKRSRAWVHHL